MTYSGSQRFRVTGIVACPLLLLLATFAFPCRLTASAGYTTIRGHFHVSTDVSEEFAAHIAHDMKSIYEEYHRLFDKKENSGRETVKIKVFGSLKDYNAAVPSEVRDTAGAYVVEERLIAAFKGDRTREEVLRTLYHEGFHQFLYDYLGPDVPLWANEGFAEYFAEANWNGKRFRTGHVPWERLQVLQPAMDSGDYIPLETLFKVESDEWLAAVREDHSRANLQYNQVWSVIHFLLHTERGRYKNRLIGYLRLIADGEGRADAFEKSFGTAIGSMEQKWRNYVLGLSADKISTCRRHMELILFLAASYYDSPGELRSMESFERDVLRNPKVRWRVEAPGGTISSSDDRARLDEMLTCPGHDQADGPRYLLLENRSDGMPELFCLGHDGIAIVAYLIREGREWESKSEIIARHALAPGLERYLIRRRQGRR